MSALLYWEDGVMLHQYTKGEITCKAYEALIKYDVNSLPVNVNFKNRVSLLSIQLLSKVQKINVNEYDADGKLVYQSDFQRYIVLYDNTAPPTEIRWLIALVVAYIELYPDMKDDVELSHVNNSVVDFAYIFTAPDCILDKCSISSSEDIMRACGIPFYRAREKSKRLKLKFDVPSTYCANVAQVLTLDFSLFISKYKADNLKVISPALKLYQDPVKEVLLDVEPCSPEECIQRMSVFYLLSIILFICFNLG